MEKLVVVPQVVIYKNIFEDSKSLIELLEENDPQSLFGEWRPWYEQGLRKEVLFNNEAPLDTEKRKKESEILNKISAIVDFIQKDYFNDYSGDKGIWPDYIKDWSILNNPTDNKYIDYFKYTLARAGKLKKDDIMMYYHVDEFRIPGHYKKRRNVATINFYLNNEYSGGEICMYDSLSKRSFMYKPNPGDVVIMPSTSPFYHAVKTYADADRYFLRTFIEYPVNETEEGSYDWEELKRQEEEFVKNDLQLIKISSNEIVVN
jgi:hypothetical protein